jgi:hypothetical protein
MPGAEAQAIGEGDLNGPTGGAESSAVAAQEMQTGGEAIRLIVREKVSDVLDAVDDPANLNAIVEGAEGNLFRLHLKGFCEDLGQEAMGVVTEVRVLLENLMRIGSGVVADPD